MTQMKKEIIMARLEGGKKYTGARLVERLGLITFQDMVTNGRLEWKSDDSFGNKLYVKKQ